MDHLSRRSVDVTRDLEVATVVVRGARLERLGEFRVLREAGRGGMGVSSTRPSKRRLAGGSRSRSSLITPSPTRGRSDGSSARLARPLLSRLDPAAPGPPLAAVAVIKTDVEAGFDNVYKLDHDEFLEPIRSRGDFQDVIYLVRTSSMTQNGDRVSPDTLPVVDQLCFATINIEYGSCKRRSQCLTMRYLLFSSSMIQAVASDANVS